MNKYIAPMAVGAALFVSACSESDPSEDAISRPERIVAAAQAGFDKYVEVYGCENPSEIIISSARINSDPNDSILGGGKIVAQANEDGIEVNMRLPEAVIRNASVHEAFHACTDLSYIRPLSRPYEVEPGLNVTGARGFIMSFNNGTVENPDDSPFVEEGFAEWVSSGFADYIPSDHAGYIAVRQLAGKLAERSGLSREAIVELHENDDIVGLTAAFNGIEAANVTDRQLADVLLLFQDAYTYGQTPTDELINDIFFIKPTVG